MHRNSRPLRLLPRPWRRPNFRDLCDGGRMQQPRPGWAAGRVPLRYKPTRLGQPSLPLLIAKRPKSIADESARRASSWAARTGSKPVPGGLPRERLGQVANEGLGDELRPRAPFLGSAYPKTPGELRRDVGGEARDLGAPLPRSDAAGGPRAGCRGRLRGFGGDRGRRLDAGSSSGSTGTRTRGPRGLRHRLAS